METKSWYKLYKILIDEVLEYLHETEHFFDIESDEIPKNREELIKDFIESLDASLKKL